MKKAIIIGGSNGVGLAVAVDLMKRGFHVCILDICEALIRLGISCGDYGADGEFGDCTEMAVKLHGNAVHR